MSRRLRAVISELRTLIDQLAFFCAKHDDAELGPQATRLAEEMTIEIDRLAAVAARA
jgi:hypothetical protein